MKKNITITWANEKGGVGKTTLCTLFANYLSEKKVSDVCVLDCDRQHSIVDKRKFDSQSLQTDKVPYEVKQIEIEKTANGIYLFDSPGNIYLEGMVPLLGFSDVIVCPYQYEFNCLSATQKFLNLVGRIWITYLKGRQKPKLIFVPNLVIRTRGTAAELQTWKKTDEALAQAGGIVTPMVADRAPTSLIWILWAHSWMHRMIRFLRYRKRRRLRQQRQALLILRVRRLFRMKALRMHR